MIQPFFLSSFTSLFLSFFHSFPLHPFFFYLFYHLAIQRDDYWTPLLTQPFSSPLFLHFSYSFLPPPRRVSSPVRPSIGVSQWDRRVFPAHQTREVKRACLWSGLACVCSCCLTLFPSPSWRGEMGEERGGRREWGGY